MVNRVNSSPTENHHVTHRQNVAVDFQRSAASKTYPTKEARNSITGRSQRHAGLFRKHVSQQKDEGREGIEFGEHSEAEPKIGEIKETSRKQAQVIVAQTVEDSRQLNLTGGREREKLKRPPRTLATRRRGKTSILE
jgi:hypothetical protein